MKQLGPIRAVIVATGMTPSMSSMTKHRPSASLKVLDKPIVEHVIEYLILNGLNSFDLILSHHPEKIENILGNGERWGANIHYHLVPDPLRPFTSLSALLHEWKEENVLFAKGTVLPYFDFKSCSEKFQLSEKPSLLMYPHEEWSGWGFFKKNFFHEFARDTTEDNFIDKMRNTSYESLKAVPFLAITSYKNLQQNNLSLLSKTTPSHLFPSTSKMIEPGVWISRATTLHPRAKINPPVFIGEHCQIRENATVGPYVVVENNCIIDSQSSLKNTLVCQRSYIGEGLDIYESIVDRDLLINLTHETQIRISDHFILGEMKAPSLKETLLKSFGRYLAFVLILLFSPLFLILSLCYPIKNKFFVKLPTLPDINHWKTLSLYKYDIPEHPDGFFASLPLLYNIIRGDLNITGLPPHTLEEVQNLSEDWKHIYLNSKVGLITLADVELPDHASETERFTCDAYYHTHTSIKYDFRLAFRWLYMQIFGKAK
jgi:mannose-1-phosphate guanylyltransferase / phosphomannomutase